MKIGFNNGIPTTPFNSRNISSEQYQQLLIILNQGIGSSNNIIGYQDFNILQGNFFCNLVFSGIHSLSTTNIPEVASLINSIDCSIYYAATDHISCQFHILKNLVALESFIALPNGQFSHITHKRNIF